MSHFKVVRTFASAFFSHCPELGDVLATRSDPTGAPIDTRQMTGLAFSMASVGRSAHTTLGFRVSRSQNQSGNGRKNFFSLRESHQAMFLSVSIPARACRGSVGHSSDFVMRPISWLSSREY